MSPVILIAGAPFDKGPPYLLEGTLPGLKRAGYSALVSMGSEKESQEDVLAAARKHTDEKLNRLLKKAELMNHLAFAQQLFAAREAAQEEKAGEAAFQPSESEASRRLGTLLRLKSLSEAGLNELIACIKLANEIHNLSGKSFRFRFQLPDLVAKEIKEEAGQEAFHRAIEKAHELGFSISGAGCQVVRISPQGKSDEEIRLLVEGLSKARAMKMVQRVTKVFEEASKIICFCPLLDVEAVMREFEKKKISYSPYIVYSNRGEEDFGAALTKDIAEKAARVFLGEARSFFTPNAESMTRVTDKILSDVRLEELPEKKSG